MIKDKNNHLSTAKGLGIILMVIGHCGPPALIGKFIYEFHMPLFFFCSGYFIRSHDNTESLINTYRKKIKGLYLKFLLWSILFLSLHNVFIDLNIYNETIANWKEYPYSAQHFFIKAVKIIFSMNGHEQLVRSFWFFKQLFLASILVSTFLFITNKITRYRHAHLIVLILLFCTTLISKYYNWSLPAIWDISLVFMSSTFYMSGYIFRKYNLLEELNSFVFSLVSLALIVIGLFILPWINMLEYTFFNAIPFFIVAFSGTIFTINLSKIIENYKIKYFFYYLGQNTIVIFALHMLFFKIGNLLKIVIYELPIYRLAEFQIIYDYNDYFWIIYTIIGILAPLLIDYLMKQTNATKRIWSYFT